MFSFFKKRRLRRIAYRRTIINRALDWLAAHPQNHIEGTYATTLRGAKTNPGSHGAVNFCALGRIAHEAGIDGEYPSIPLQKFLKDFGGREATSFITTQNDNEHVSKEERLRRIRYAINLPQEGEIS